MCPVAVLEAVTEAVPERAGPFAMVMRADEPNAWYWRTRDRWQRLYDPQAFA
jgi:hypothetical protein